MAEIPAHRSLLSPQAEDYLKAIYLLGRQSRVGTQLLAGELGVSPASVSGMLKRLSELGLLVHRPYYGAELTGPGEQVALEILRHHRLLELYLSERLGYTFDRVHEEADRLEHVISEDLEARICSDMGDPSYDPHGHPIPRVDGSVPGELGRPLSERSAGQPLCISSLAGPPLQQLELIALGLGPGVTLTVLSSDAVRGTLEIQLQAGREVLGLEVARRILTVPETPGNGSA